MVELGPLLPRCFHDDALPVEDVTGELVAMLCLDCDQQLPADRKSWPLPPLPPFTPDPRLTVRIKE